jgi:hypothetical protein
MKLDEFFFTQGGGFIQHSPIKVHKPKNKKYDGEQTLYISFCKEANVR